MKTASLKEIKKYFNSEREILLFDSLPSTMESVKEREVFAVIAKSQTQGKGTKNRRFISSEGGIYLSATLNVNLKSSSLSLITPYFATAVGKALKEYGIPYEYKWVNDVYLNGKKLCGILTETSFTGSSLTEIVVGIGLNVYQTSFPKELESVATSLELEGYNVDINRLIALLLKGIEQFESEFCKGEFLTDYKQNSLVIGKSVKLETSGKVILGKVVKIGDGGELVIDDGCSLVSAFVGDLTIL